MFLCINIRKWECCCCLCGCRCCGWIWKWVTREWRYFWLSFWWWWRCNECIWDDGWWRYFRESPKDMNCPRCLGGFVSPQSNVHEYCSSISIVRRCVNLICRLESIYYVFVGVDVHIHILFHSHEWILGTIAMCALWQAASWCGLTRLEMHTHITSIDRWINKNCYIVSFIQNVVGGGALLRSIRTILQWT